MLFPPENPVFGGNFQAQSELATTLEKIRLLHLQRLCSKREENFCEPCAWHSMIAVRRGGPPK
jgi:hypothetical protein